MQTAQRSFTSYGAVKLLALAAMTLDHLGSYLWPELEWLRVVGRYAAPLFCFLVGWNQRYQFRRELLIVAVAMTVVDALFMRAVPLNILWVILGGRWLLALLEQGKLKASAPMAVLACILWLPISLLLFEYGTLAILWMLWGRAVRKEPKSVALLYGGCATLLGSAAMLYGFDFSPWSNLAIIAVFLSMFILLPRFQLREYAGISNTILVGWSRHALIYYFIHRTVLMAAGAVMGTMPSGAAWL